MLQRVESRDSASVLKVMQYRRSAVYCRMRADSVLALVVTLVVSMEREFPTMGVLPLLGRLSGRIGNWG
jgi:hypothetical protein